MKHLPLRECGYAIVVVVVLLALYGAYLAMVQRSRHLWNSRPIYRFGDEQARCFFAPAHEIDRRLRPDFWQGLLDDHPPFYQTLETTTINPVGVMGTAVEKSP